LLFQISTCAATTWEEIEEEKRREAELKGELVDLASVGLHKLNPSFDP
jgi:hypothetical protein